MFFFPVFLRTRVVVLLLSSNIYFTQKYWEYIVLYIQSMSFIVYTSSNNKTGIWLSNKQYTPIGLVGTFRNSAHVGLGGGGWWLRTSKVYVSCIMYGTNSLSYLFFLCFLAPPILSNRYHYLFL